MKNLLLALATIATVSFQAYAAESAPVACVPTQTVEQAKAEYDAGVAQINAIVLQSYAQAKAEYDASSAASLVTYNQTVAAIDANYEKAVKEIHKQLKPGWQDAVAAEVQKRNAAVDQAVADYTAVNQGYIAVYNQKVAAAQAAFNAEAKVLANRYNQAVCAG